MNNFERLKNKTGEIEKKVVILYLIKKNSN